jgi:hypothetical protein
MDGAKKGNIPSGEPGIDGTGSNISNKVKNEGETEK